jgi:23S rRNA (cytosine1962-C5)-methyltransferase
MENSGGCWLSEKTSGGSCCHYAMQTQFCKEIHTRLHPGQALAVRRWPLDAHPHQAASIFQLSRRQFLFLDSWLSCILSAAQSALWPIPEHHNQKSSSMNNLILKEGRERSLLHGHPWLFSGAVQRVQGNPQPGTTVDAVSADGQTLGRGAYSPSSQIRLRIWTFDAQELVDEAFFARRIEAAVRLRASLGIPAQSNACRLVASEADGLPGVTADRYADFIVCQFLSVGAERWKNVIAAQLRQTTGLENIYERSDADVRKKESLQPHKGVLCGNEPPDLLEIEENGMRFLVDIKSGHKTGFYLDQRDNRNAVRIRSAGAEVLNCFAYTGGFGLAALHGKAKHVTNVEDRADFIGLIEKNIQLNGFAADRCTNLKADVFQLLRQYLQEGRSFDLIVLDPPKFAESQANLERAARGYKDINLLAFKLLRPGGLLFTFSCSGLMKMELFQKIVADAAVDSKRDAQLLHWLGQSADHPVKLAIPETQYLKGLCLRAS